MIHMRMVSPSEHTDQALAVLRGNPSVSNVAVLRDASVEPPGDLVLADVAREDASVVLGDLRELDLHRRGAIFLHDVDAAVSERAEAAERHAKGAPSDAVVWEEMSARTEETTELSGSFLAFMVLAALIAGVGIYLDSAILIIGAMVVGPEFGPIAGLCVAAATRRRDVAGRSALALAVGFPVAILCVYTAMAAFRASGIATSDFSTADHGFASVVSNPDFFAFFVAACAGAAGVLSLSTAKSGALIGVLISVTTIPAAANVGLAAAYEDWDSVGGSFAQLVVNLSSILVAGTTTLVLQRLLYQRRRRRHLYDPVRAEAGLPVGRSRRSRGGDR